MSHILVFFNGAKFWRAHTSYMRFPKRTKNVTDRFFSRFWVIFHFKSSKTTRYCVFYDKIILNLRVSFLFKLFLFIGKSVLGWLNFKKVGKCQNFTRLFSPTFLHFVYKSYNIMRILSRSKDLANRFPV